MGKLLQDFSGRMAMLDVIFIEMEVVRFPHFESADSEIVSAIRRIGDQRRWGCCSRNFFRANGKV